VVHTSKVQPSAMYLQHTLSLVKVNVDFAGRASDVDYLNMVGELQQSEAGSQRLVDCSRECGVRDDAGLRILEPRLLLFLVGSDGAGGTQHVPQCVGQACRALPRLSQIVSAVCLHHLSTRESICGGIPT
jgi:hypothetical protein